MSPIDVITRLRINRLYKKLYSLREKYKKKEEAIFKWHHKSSDYLHKVRDGEESTLHNLGYEANYADKLQNELASSNSAIKRLEINYHKALEENEKEERAEEERLRREIREQEAKLKTLAKKK